MKNTLGTLSPDIGDAILVKYGWVVITDIGIPSGALTYRPPTTEEWKYIESVIDANPEVGQPDENGRTWIELP